MTVCGRQSRAWLCALLLLLGVAATSASVSCTNDNDCDEILEVDGGKCIEGTCTNPFYHNGGCLSSMLGDDWRLKSGAPRRVCGSEDPPEAEELGYCRTSPLDEFYTEVRILVLGWESSYFQAWILQILLSEVLQVPVSIETGGPEGSDDFYGINTPLDYPKYDANYEELSVSSEVLDCRLDANNSPSSSPDTYRACAHVVPEVWEADSLVQSKAEGTGPFRELGMLTAQKWYIPKFTALKDPSLTTIYGIAGPNNREKLARTFKRPTTWKEYCDEVSLDGCSTDDGVAARPPSESEEDSMFSEGSYTGHFRFTKANICNELGSEPCTGHFADYPCGWNSQAPNQIYHNEIALQSDGTNDHRGGYSYSQLVGIWRAANATKEDVMIMWWTPEILFEEFFGTDAEFVPVNLAQPTQECYENRPPRGSMCDTEYDVTTSDPRGSCDYKVQSIKKFISDGLYETTFDSAIPEALQSPAYSTIDNYRMSTLQLNEIFQLMLDRKKDYNFDARYATCKWVVNNLDNVLSWIPEDHPRSIKEVETSTYPLFIAALSVAFISTVVVIFAFVNTVRKKNTKVVYYAQFGNLVILLVGLLLLSVGTILMVIPQTDGSCVSISWLVNLGYAIHFAPLVAKVFAINGNLANSGKQMQRVRLGKAQLYRAVALLTTLVAIFLIVWTVIEKPCATSAYALSDETTESGETIVTEINYCGSFTEIWEIASLAWQAVVLLPTAVVAFVACRVKEDMNDTKPLSMIVYAHSFFLISRASLMLLDNGAAPAELMAYNSLLISGDILVAIVTYFLPIFLSKEEELKKDEEILPDLFLNSSIFVADVMGFTAWSSAREPHQVFKLLETLYESFDQIANKHNVFKVETVRDCYVAATGIPNPQAKHAEIISKFAIDIMKKMDHLSKKLELMFGPDTSELNLRIGIHSGPVTGGFLKGKGARFQLFGDTMTTACLIHTSGQNNRIHLSRATANLLIENGCKRWVKKREINAFTEEKGELETYWLIRGVKQLGGFSDTASLAHSDFMSLASGSSDDLELYGDSRMRWVEWNVEVLANVLKQILAQRETSNFMDESVRSVKNVTRRSGISTLCIEAHSSPLAMPLDEVAEIIELPAFDKRAMKRQRDSSYKTELDPEIMTQLREYVTMVASMYKDNPFHNFAHASYVVMAVKKYMSRIMSASEVDVGDDRSRHLSATQEALHDHTYGITSDPLTRFACVFSALIHDIDHPGVPNPQFVEENERLSRIYKKRSVAEQNSFDLAWDLLMDDRFSRLRNAISSNVLEFRRFRQIVVNSVMATDLGDKQSKELRNGRWKKAFAIGDEVQEESLSNSKNRKATIIIEHLIQAADIAHTCQHWGLYRKWNERLFQECYKAYRDGRAEKNPADGWYEGEIGFYDFYIIPLAKKLRDCGVFGPTSDENLNYAKSNRSQWEREGRAIVSEMVHKAEEEYNAQYMAESANNISPEGEFYSNEFDDEQISVNYDGKNRDDSQVSHQPTIDNSEISRFEDEKETNGQVAVRFSAS